MYTHESEKETQRIPPSRADAEKAAAVLEEAGVGQVMLFGSVALGEQTPGSDIDLAAIYDDLDYGQRDSLAASLGAAATEAVGYQVEVLVTDRPEWMRRTRSLKTSMERHIASYGQLLVDRPPGEVNRSKEMVLATTDLDEARRKLGSVDRAASQLRSYLGGAVTARRERDAEHYRTELLWACAAAHAVVAESISALIHLAAIPGTFTWGRIDELRGRLPEPHRRTVHYLLRPPGTYNISRWREKRLPFWTQSHLHRPRHDGLQPAAHLVEAVAWAACRMALYADGQIPGNGNTSRHGWRNSPTKRVIETLEDYDLRTGKFRGNYPWGDLPNRP